MYNLSSSALVRKWMLSCMHMLDAEVHAIWASELIVRNQI
jgi:hypothetical protein